MKQWLLSKNQEREQRCPYCNVQLDITILRDLKKDKEKKEMEGFQDRTMDKRKINHISPNVNMSDDRQMLRDLRDMSTLQYNPGIEYNPDAEIDGIKKNKSDKR